LITFTAQLNYNSITKTPEEVPGNPEIPSGV